MATVWTLYPGTFRIPDAASPDVRARSYRVVAEIRLRTASDDGVLVAHGDRHAGYALRVEAGRLVHDYVHAGVHSLVRSAHQLPAGRWLRVAVDVRRRQLAGDLRLLVDDEEVARGRIPALARARTGYTGVDVGCDRGLTVGGYPAPARFTGDLRWVDVIADDDQWLDVAAIVELEASTG